MPEGTPHPHLSPPLRAAVAELRRLQEALRQPLADEAALEAIWSGLTGLRRQLPEVGEGLSGDAQALHQRTHDTVEGLITALGPVREERRATRALKEAINTFETQVNRPSATVASPAEATRLLGLLEQIRWKVDSIPIEAQPGGPRAQALASLREAMGFAAKKLEARASELTDQGEVAAARSALRRIVDESVDFDDADSVAKTLARLDALSRTLTIPLGDAEHSKDLTQVIGEIRAVRDQIRQIAEGREAAKVIRNAIHGYNAAARTVERGPTAPEVAANLRAHVAELSAALEGVRDNAMPEELRGQYTQIEAAIQAILAQLR